MKRTIGTIGLILIAMLLVSGPGSDLRSQEQPVARVKYWLFFRDQGPNPSARLGKLRQDQHSFLSERALKRRAKVCPEPRLVDQSDLPIYEPYLARLAQQGLVPIVKSNWLNAATFNLTPAERKQIQELPFVQSVQPVKTYRRRLISEPQAPIAGLNKSQTARMDYGNSAAQNELIRVDAVHDFGIYGEGVFIGLLDDGFDTRNHPTFQAINVVTTWDFINNDGNTFFESNQDCGSQGNHGTNVLSIMAGFDPGQLIGPAFKADFALAKTEKVCDPSTGSGFEQPIEEDYWVAGLEWLENLGVDIASSSLGYNDWYSYENMDGNTAVTTRAADLAVKKGLVVLTSAGNEGNGFWRHIVAPSDGDSVIAVGAVYSDRSIVGFSSRGPSYDGRIKPDLMAMGSSVYHASGTGKLAYTYGGGTSYSCPQVAGVAALILSAHPELTPMQVRDALRQTADQATSPNNDFGWGIIDAWQAVQYYGITFSSVPELTILPGGDYQITINVVSKNGVQPGSVQMDWRIGATGSFQPIHLSPESDYAFKGTLGKQATGSTIELYFTAMDLAGQSRTHPFDISKQVFRFTAGDTFVGPGDGRRKLPEAFALYQNFPNPFHPPLGTTRIRFDIKQAINGSLKIYNVLGQCIRTLVPERRLAPGQYANFYWDGLDDLGQPASSGTYYVRLKAADFSQTRTLTLIREK